MKAYELKNMLHDIPDQDEIVFRTETNFIEIGGASMWEPWRGLVTIFAEIGDRFEREPLEEEEREDEADSLRTLGLSESHFR